MKKRIYALLMAAVMMFGISACGGSAEGPQAVENPSVVTLAAGDPAASYFAFSNLLAGYMGDAADEGLVGGRFVQAGKIGLPYLRIHSPSLMNGGTDGALHGLPTGQSIDGYDGAIDLLAQQLAGILMEEGNGNLQILESIGLGGEVQ